jgi:hypothetical protein
MIARSRAMFTGGEPGSGPARSGYARGATIVNDGVLVDALVAVNRFMDPCTRKGRRLCGPECAVHVQCTILDKEEILGYLLADTLGLPLIPQEYARSVGKAARQRATRAAPDIKAAARRGDAALDEARQCVAIELPLPSRRRCAKAAEQAKPSAKELTSPLDPVEQRKADVAAAEQRLRSTKRAREALGPDELDAPSPPRLLERQWDTLPPMEHWKMFKVWSREEQQARYERNDEREAADDAIDDAKMGVSAAKRALARAVEFAEREPSKPPPTPPPITAAATAAATATSSRRCAVSAPPQPAPASPPPVPLVTHTPKTSWPNAEHVNRVMAATLASEERAAVRQAKLEVWQAARAVGAQFYLHDTITGWTVSRHPPPVPSDPLVHDCVADCLSDCVLLLESDEIRRAANPLSGPTRRLSVRVPMRAMITN